MKRTTILTTFLLAASNIVTLASNPDYLDDDVKIGVDFSVSDVQSADYSSHSDQSGHLVLTFSGNDADAFIGARAVKGEEYLDGDFSYGTDGNVHLSGDGHMTRLIDKSGYGLTGGANWQINSNNVLGISAEFNATPKHDIHDQSYNSIRKIDDVLNSDALIGSISNIGSHEIDETPIDFDADLNYNGTLNGFDVKFNANYFMNQNGRNSTIEELDLENNHDVILSRNLDKNRMVASCLNIKRQLGTGTLDFGGELTYSYHYSDYFLGGSVPNTQSSQNDVYENNVSVFANYGFSFPVNSLIVGLRYEHLDFDYANVLDRIRDINRKSDRLFPTVQLTGAVGPVLYALDYSSGFARPDFTLYNDAVHYGSSFMLQSGNSRLVDQISQDVNLRVNYKTFILSGSYSRLDNPIVQMFSLVETESPYYKEGAIIGKPVNIDSPMRDLSLDLDYLTNIVGNVSLEWKGGVFTQWFEFDADDEHHLSFSGKPIWYAGLTGSAALWQNNQMEIGFDFRSKGYRQNTYIENNTFGLTAAFEQKFLKDNSLTLRIEGKDLLRRSYCNTSFDCGELTVKKYYVADTRRIEASISYSFDAVQKHDYGKKAGNDIKNRMK